VRGPASGWFVGPTVLTTGKIIAPFGGQSQRVSPEQGPFWRFEYIDADTPDEIRKAVRQNIYYGAEAIKLVADNSSFYYTREEIAAAVAEAHAAGLPVSVHVIGGEAARNVILGGADSIEHGFLLSDELLRIQKVRGTIAPGMAADIVAVPSNPLENLAALKQVSFVMKDGRVVKQPQKR